jgi:hypothetical protein
LWRSRALTQVQRRLENPELAEAWFKVLDTIRPRAELSLVPGVANDPGYEDWASQMARQLHQETLAAVAALPRPHGPQIRDQTALELSGYLREVAAELAIISDRVWPANPSTRVTVAWEDARQGATARDRSMLEQVEAEIVGSDLADREESSLHEANANGLSVEVGLRTERLLPLAEAYAALGEFGAALRVLTPIIRGISALDRRLSELGTPASRQEKIEKLNLVTFANGSDSKVAALLKGVISRRAASSPLDCGERDRPAHGSGRPADSTLTAPRTTLEAIEGGAWTAAAMLAPRETGWPQGAEALLCMSRAIIEGKRPTKGSCLGCSWSCRRVRA